MTEGNGHVIDPNGDARRALQEAVAEHGPEVLSNAGVMENICRDHLAGLPGESILIGDASRTNVPALLGDLIPQLGNYGAIQSAAATLAGEHSLDMAASLWVVREFARALGYIAPATGTAAAFPGSGPRPVPGSGPRPVPGSGPPPGADPAERSLGTGGSTGASEDSGTVGAGSEGSETVRPGGGEAGRAVAGGAAAGAAAAAATGAAGVAADEAGRGEGASGESAASGPGASPSGPRGPGESGAGDSGAAGTSGASVSGTSASGVSGVSATGAGGQAGAGGETIPRGVAASRAGQVGGDGSVASGSEPGYGTGAASGGTGQASGSPGNTGPDGGSGPGATGPIGGGPVGTGPMREVSGASGPPAGAAGSGPSAPGGAAGSGTAGSGTGGAGTGSGGTGGGGGRGGAAPEGEPGFPLPLPAGRLPGRQSQRSNLLNRNTVGIAAAIALIAGYLGVAAVAHLSPFPAKAVPTVSASQSSSPPASTSSSPASSPDPSADPSPTSQRDILLTKIPATVKDPDRCQDAGTKFGATAISQCQKLQGVAANTIIYYQFSSHSALVSGFSQFLEAINFRRAGVCTTKGSFTDFIVNCRSDFTVKTPGATGSVAEYTNSDHQPIIVSTDNDQNVMAVLIGINDGDLLAYWNQLKWVVTP